MASRAALPLALLLLGAACGPESAPPPVPAPEQTTPESPAAPDWRGAQAEVVALAGMPELPTTWATDTQRQTLAQLRRETSLLSLDPDDLTRRASVASLWIRAGRCEGALAVLGVGLASAPDTPALLDLAASAFIELQQLEPAQALLARQLELVPEDPDAWLRRATLLDRLGRHRASADCLARGLDLAPEHPDLTLAAGREAWRGSDLPQARALLQRAVDAAPSSLEPRYLLAAVLREQGDLPAAEIHERAHQRLARLDDLGLPDSYPPWRQSLELGAAWLAEGEPQLARSELQEVLATRYDPRAANLLVEALLASNAPDPATQLTALELRHPHLAGRLTPHLP